MLHADPHPGNFLVQEDGTVGVIDFGCVKEVPEAFYKHYFSIVRGEVLDNPVALDEALHELEFYKPGDDEHKKTFYRDLLVESIQLVTRPFRSETFDFGDKAFFEDLHAYGEKMQKDKKLRNADSVRGSAHGIYINRTYFGLYNILHQLGAKVDTRLKQVAQL
jgi:predicted unusual protein kinase regulating ubiquinone biosynthesis (AarF/ABC1/UbiB family)